MEGTSKFLLEQYALGKDQDKHQILESIFAEDAHVYIEINSTKITFPSNITGNRDIAKTLSADFNKKYEKVKTYYLSETQPGMQNIQQQPWLVVMKEIGKDFTRVGTGYYNWEFKKDNQCLKIMRLKIYIHEMLELHDPESIVLKEIQDNIEYPWSKRNTVAGFLERFEQTKEIALYLKKDVR